MTMPDVLNLHRREMQALLERINGRLAETRVILSDGEGAIESCERTLGLSSRATSAAKSILSVTRAEIE